MVALSAYIASVQRLLNNPSGSLYSVADLTTYINTARQQLAAESESVRVLGTLSTVNAQQAYPFSAIVLGGAPGVLSAISVRMVSLANVSGGAAQLISRPWEWFNRYFICVPVPAIGNPAVWAKYNQGNSGSLYLSPIPNANGLTLNCDVVCLPIPLTSDADADAIPYPWTDAVPYFAAYLAFLNAQRIQDAQRMMELYEVFTLRGRQMTTPTVLPGNFQGGRAQQLASQHGLLTGAGQQQGGGRA